MTVATMKTGTATPKDADARLLARVLDEGYGPGAWHGADLRAALADLTARTALVRPAPGRHNAAEIALHHAWCIRGVAARLAGSEPAPFPLDGEDWFPVHDESRLTWAEIVGVLEAQHQRLLDVVNGIADGTITSPVAPAERLELALGVTCHAVYHAGQVQLIKVLTAAAA